MEENSAESSETEEDSSTNEQVVPTTKSVQQYVHPSTSLFLYKILRLFKIKQQKVINLCGLKYRSKTLFC